MVTVRMLQTRHATNDGFAIHRYVQGCIYTVTGSLADSLLRIKAAEVVEVPERKQAA